MQVLLTIFTIYNYILPFSCCKVNGYSNTQVLFHEQFKITLYDQKKHIYKNKTCIPVRHKRHTARIHVFI